MLANLIRTGGGGTSMESCTNKNKIIIIIITENAANPSLLTRTSVCKINDIHNTISRGVLHITIEYTYDCTQSRYIVLRIFTPSSFFTLFRQDTP